MGIDGIELGLALSTLVSGATALFMGAKYADQFETTRFYKRLHDEAQMENASLKSKLWDHEDREAKRRDHLRSIAKKGKAAQIEAVKAKRAVEAADEAARTERTLSALKSTQFRSRAQVVAPVKAARTKAKNATA